MCPGRSGHQHGSLVLAALHSIWLAIHGTFLQHLTVLLDWVGTLAFALSGALVGVQKRFDLFGVLFLAFVVAVVGGMMRDVLIGAVPPVAITDIHFCCHRDDRRRVDVLLLSQGDSAPSHPILLLDAVGLALFAVIGAEGNRSWYQSIDGRDFGNDDRDRWRDDP